jgi:hypothetical protein
LPAIVGPGVALVQPWWVRSGVAVLWWAARGEGIALHHTVVRIFPTDGGSALLSALLSPPPPNNPHIGAPKPPAAAASPSPAGSWLGRAARFCTVAPLQSGQAGFWDAVLLVAGLQVREE